MNTIARISRCTWFRKFDREAGEWEGSRADQVHSHAPRYRCMTPCELGVRDSARLQLFETDPLTQQPDLMCIEYPIRSQFHPVIDEEPR
jgi:hypothetical protein